MAVREAERFCNFCDREVGVGQHIIGAVDFLFQDKLLQRTPCDFCEQMREIFGVVAEMCSDIGDTDVFGNVQADIINNIRVDLLLRGLRRVGKKLRVLTELSVELREYAGGHRIERERRIAVLYGILELLHQHDHFFKLMYGTHLREQKRIFFAGGVPGESAVKCSQ